MQTYGSQAWDASFAIQALLATNLSDEIGPTLMKAHDFLKQSQVYIISPIMDCQMNFVNDFLVKIVLLQTFSICINVSSLTFCLTCQQT
jgi:hypothetical protein